MVSALGLIASVIVGVELFSSAIVGIADVRVLVLVVAVVFDTVVVALLAAIVAVLVVACAFDAVFGVPVIVPAVSGVKLISSVIVVFVEVLVEVRFDATIFVLVFFVSGHGWFYLITRQYLQRDV